MLAGCRIIRPVAGD